MAAAAQIRLPSLLGRWLAIALVDERLPRWLEAPVHGLIGRRPSWRAFYNDLRSLDQVAVGGGAEQHELLERLVMARVEPQRAAQPTLRMLAAATAGAALAVVVMWPRTPLWSAREASQPAVGVRVRCVSSDQGSPLKVLGDAAVAPGAVGPDIECPNDGRLLFSVTNLSREPRHLFVVGIAESGDARWYAPFDEQRRSVLVQPGAVDRALDALATTSAMPRDERVTLHALFAPNEISGATVAQALQAARASGLALGSLDRVPVHVEQQARIELRRGGAQGP